MNFSFCSLIFGIIQNNYLVIVIQQNKYKCKKLTTGTKKHPKAAYFLPIASIRYPNSGVLINGANEERLPSKFISDSVIDLSNLVSFEVNMLIVPDGHVNTRPRL